MRGKRLPSFPFKSRMFNSNRAGAGLGDVPVLVHVDAGGEHRAGGVADDLFGDAAEENVGEAGVAMGGHDNQVGVDFLGVVDNFLVGNTVTDLTVTGKPRGFAVAGAANDFGPDTVLNLAEKLRADFEIDVRRHVLDYR